MSADTRVQIYIDHIPSIDWEFASQHLFPRPGCVVVEQWPEPESRNGILIAGTEGSQWRAAPDVGTVLAVGEPLTTNDPHVNLFPGDVVCFDHGHGKRIDNFSAGGYETDRVVRIFGRAMLGGEPIRIPWCASCLARLEFMENDPNRIRFIAVGDQVVVRRDPLHDQVNGVFVPDSARSRPSRGIVDSVGELVDDLEPGDHVLYMATAVTPWRQVVGPNVDNDLGMLRVEGIVCKYFDSAHELVGSLERANLTPEHEIEVKRLVERSNSADQDISEAAKRELEARFNVPHGTLGAGALGYSS